MTYTVFRCEKVKANGVSYVHNHNQRTYQNKNAENIDFSRTHLNEVLLGSSDTHGILKEKLSNLNSTKAIRKDANVMLEMIFSASAEYFYKDLDKDKFNNLHMNNAKDKIELQNIFANQLDKQKLEDFKNTVIKFCKQKFKDNVVNLTLHLDEKTPHFHLTLTPVIDGKLSAKRFFTPATTQGWQNDFAAYCKPLGLVKGIDNSAAVHQSCKDYQSSIAVEIPEPPNQKVRPIMSPKNVFDKNFLGIEKQVIPTKEILEDNNNRVKEQRVHYNFYKNFYNENKNSIKKTQQAITENTKLREENKMYKTQIKKINEEKLEDLRQIPLVEVLQKLGYYPKQESGNFYRLKFNELNLVINVEKNSFTENKNNINGFGSINLLTNVFKYDFKQAIEILSSDFKSEAIAKEISTDKKASEALIKDHLNIAKNEIPQPDPKNKQKGIDYLVNERQIDKNLVEELYNKGLIYTDKRNNVVFVNEDKSFAFIRGTFKDKRFVCNKGKMDFITYSNDTTKDNLYLFESTIDLLSYRTLYPEAKGTFVSISGSAMINRLAELKLDDYKNVVCCFDNDEQGKKFNEKVNEITLSTVKIDSPIRKDFNEELIVKNNINMVHKAKGIKAIEKLDENHEEQLKKTFKLPTMGKSKGFDI